MNFSVDLLAAYEQSDIIGKLIIYLLLMVSGFSWVIIGLKWFQFKKLNREESLFYEDYYRHADQREDLFLNTLSYQSNPIAIIFQQTFADFWWKNHKKERVSIDYYQSRIENQIENLMNLQQRYMITLATTANISPLIGLFGTVWGILGVFQKLGLLGSAEIVTLAPGISTALLTTIVGLFAAVPAAFFYNRYNRMIQDLTVRTEIFSVNLLDWLAQEIVKADSNTAEPRLNENQTTL